MSTHIWVHPDASNFYVHPPWIHSLWVVGGWTAADMSTSTPLAADAITAFDIADDTPSNILPLGEGGQVADCGVCTPRGMAAFR